MGSMENFEGIRGMWVYIVGSVEGMGSREM